MELGKKIRGKIFLITDFKLYFLKIAKHTIKQ